MNEDEIKRAIERLTYRYSEWTIGITEDPETRRRSHRNPKGWSQWRANTETVARRIESYYLVKGMKGGTGGGDHPTYVYIFQN